MKEQSRVVSIRTKEMIENEAADWLVKLDSGKLKASDRLELKNWLSQGPDYVNALKSYASIWGDMDNLLNEFPARQETEPFKTLSSIPYFRKTSLALAAAVIGTIGLTFWMSASVEQPVTTETSFHVTPIGKQQVQQFSDGSSAHLNTNSMIEIEYSQSARVVRLLRGEAMFDVAHDPARPFIVYAGVNQVTAIGTKFVVRLTSENIIVTVADGQVQLSYRPKGGDNSTFLQEQEVIVVSEGEQVEINDKTPMRKPEEIDDDELQRRLSWLDGQLVFENERLEQVILEISRYVPDRIIIDDPELGDIRINGRFQIGDTDALLEAIEMSFSVQARHIDEQTIRVSR